MYENLEQSLYAFDDVWESSQKTKEPAVEVEFVIEDVYLN